MALLDSSIQRRDFLKLSAAAALAAAGISGCTPGADGGGEGLTPHVVASDTAILEGKGKWVMVDCPWNCAGSRCINYEYVVDGVPIRHKTADVQEDTDELPQLRSCPRGVAGRQVAYNANRVKYPMKRKNWQPGGGAGVNGHLRGVDEWERISWDEALDIVASELKRVYADYGPEAVFAIMPDNILNRLGGAVSHDSTRSAGTFTLATSQIGFNYNGMASCWSANDRTDLVNADTVVLYGINSVWASGGNSSYYWKKAHEAGVEFIHVGPDYSDSANLLDARWIRVRPGTDTAFLLAVAYEMLRLDSEGKEIIDWDFLHKYCVGFDAESMPTDEVRDGSGNAENKEHGSVFAIGQATGGERAPIVIKLNENFKDYVLGEYDGVPKTPEWASEICGTPVEDITWYAEKIGKKNNVMLLHAYAPARHNGSEDFPQLFMTIGWMGGHVGRPGNATGTGFGEECGNSGPKIVQYGQPSANTATVPNPITTYVGLSEVWQCMLEGKYYHRGFAGMGVPNGFNLVPEEEHPLDIKLIYSNQWCNLFQTVIGIPYAIEAFRKVETVIWCDTRDHLSAQFSDILLPATYAWEGNLDPSQGELSLGSMFMYQTKYNHERDHISVPSPCTLPLYEHMSEEWIRTELMKRLGQDPKEEFPISFVQKYFDTIAGAKYLAEDGVTMKPVATVTQEDIDAWGVVGTPQTGDIGFKELFEKGYFQVSRKAGDGRGYIAYEDYIADPVANPRPSASGKFEIYCQAKADNINATGYARSELKPYPTYRLASQSYEDTFSNWETKEKGEFPFQIINPHYPRSAHSAFDESNVLQEAFQRPVFLNADDAAAKGINTGDTILVRSATGKILRKASLTHRLMPGVISIPHGARTDWDFEKGIDRGGSDNSLTSRNQQSEWFPQCETYNSLLVDFEKYSEEIPDDFEKDPFVFLKEE